MPPAEPAEHPLSAAVAVVTGAGRGIGRAIALELGARGAAVVAAARTKDDLYAVAAEISGCGGRAHAVVCDVNADLDVERLAEETERAFGPATVLVNCAGCYRAVPFLQAELADFREVMDVNYLGTVRVTRAFLPAMISAGYGRVVNIASTAGKYGSRYQSMYNAAKHAVVGLTRCLGLELAATGVRVNAVCPGFVDTPMLAEALPGLAAATGASPEAALASVLSAVPIGRLLRPEEISHLAVYLASPEADGITGQAYTVSGGMLLI